MSLKIGIIGAGMMLKYQVEAFRSAGAKVTCIADMNPTAAQKAASTYNIPITYSTLEEMLDKASDQIDAVSILTPPVSHKMIAVHALQSGKHVFCEKPPAINATDVQEMANAAVAADKHLLFDFNNRLRPESLEI